jgi:hypothetical protein
MLDELSADAATAIAAIWTARASARNKVWNCRSPLADDAQVIIDQQPVLLGMRHSGLLDRDALVAEMIVRGHDATAINRLNRLIDKAYQEPERRLWSDRISAQRHELARSTSSRWVSR